MNFYDVLAAEKWGGGIPTINFFDLLFAQSISGGQWETYEGTLPATINANGDDMRQYQVYGAAGGVGDRTVNLFDKDTALDGYEIVNNGTQRNENWCVSDFIPVESDTLYKSRSSGGAVLSYTDKSSQPTRLNGVLNTNGVRTLSETKFIRMNCQIWQKASCIVAKSEDLSETFVPFGYKVDISTSDGTNDIITPIYIGDEPLDKDEYVDYQAGKIYRYETEIKKDVSQTGWQWRWETDDVTYQKPANNRVSVGCFYPEETKEYIISAVPDTFEVAVISADSSDVKTADTGWGASWTLSGASAHSFCVTVRKFDNSDITPSEVDGVKFKVTSLTPTDPPVSLPALPTCEGTTVLDYAGQSVAPEKVYFEYQGGK